MQIGLSSLPDRAPDPTNTDPGSHTSGPGFDRLIAAAQAEADRRKAIADQSGASADQFSEQSWLQIFKAHGAEIGFGAVAGKIVKDSHGQLTVADPALRAKILNYRGDNLVRSVMAVKRASDSKAALNIELGRQASDGELRAAEVVGPAAAAKLIATRQSTPYASAAIVAPDAALANRATFFRPDGSPQTVNEVLVKLMKPAESAAGAEAAKAAVTGLSTALGGTVHPASDLMSQAQTGQSMDNPAAKPIGFGAAATLPTSAPKARVAAAPPPDLPLVSKTIGNLSMPGTARGQAAPTGGKVTGWRAQIGGEVTNQIEHPESLVNHAPSRVTIPAPDTRQRQPIDQYATFAPEQSVAPVTQTLGPQLVRSSGSTQPISAVAYAPAVPVQSTQPAQTQPAAVQTALAQPVPQVATTPILISPTQVPSAQQTQSVQSASAPVPQPAAQPLPTLVAGNQQEPTSALPLLPIEQNNAPLQLGNPLPAAPATSQAATEPRPIATTVEIAPAPPSRPSRYGPAAYQPPRLPQSGVLGYAEPTPASDMPGLSEASSAGIRPSRYLSSSAVATQQYAAIGRLQTQASQPLPQPVAPAAAPPSIVQPQAAVGVDGTPLLPPVPGPAGLPPLTATEALASGAPNTASQYNQQTALFSGMKPLDLAPTALTPPLSPAPITSPPQPVAQRQRPRLTPPFSSGR